MKHSPTLVIILFSCLALTGCQMQSEAYTGLNQDNDGNPIEIQLISEVGLSPILTIWDDRDRALNYVGKVKLTGEVEFSAIQYSCRLHGIDLMCNTPTGEILLSQKSFEQQQLKNYQGQYQAVWNESLYRMKISPKGKVKIKGEGCHSSAEFSESREIDNLVAFRITQDDCGLKQLHGYSTLQVENESLYSVELLTSDPHFPVNWVRLN